MKKGYAPSSRSVRRSGRAVRSCVAAVRATAFIEDMGTPGWLGCHPGLAPVMPHFTGVSNP